MSGLHAHQAKVYALGGGTSALTNALYPVGTMTRLHKALHLGGATHAYMDMVPGAYHRALHGHDLVIDGVNVLRSPNMKFGEMLHHLGCDCLTATGVPIPVLSRALVRLGVSQKIVSEYCSVNLPKLLNGSLCLLVSGIDVLAVFSDAIPHTYLAAGKHALLGALGVAGGIMGKNPLVIASGGLELSVAATTLYRAITEPVIPAFGVPASAFLPALSATVPLAAVLAAGGCVLAGKPLRRIGTTVASAAAGQTAACIGGAAASAGALGAIGATLGGLSGPVIGVGAYLLCKKLLESAIPERRIGRLGRGTGRAWSPVSPAYTEVQSTELLTPPLAFPAIHASSVPIGSIREGRLLFDPGSVRACLAQGA